MGWPYPPDHANLLAIPFNQGQVVLDLLVDAQATQDLKKTAAHGMLVAVELFIRHEACGHGQGDPVGRRVRILAILPNG